MIKAIYIYFMIIEKLLKNYFKISVEFKTLLCNVFYLKNLIIHDLTLSHILSTFKFIHLYILKLRQN